MRASIIIPSCKKENLIPCLESIYKYTDLTDIEIICVANGYDGESVENVKWISFPERIGYTKATNAGIKEAKGDYIILLNDDTTLLEQPFNNWIETLLNPFEDEKVGITAPLKVYDEYSKREFAIFFCVAIRRKLFDELKVSEFDYLDAATFSPGGGEDIDFSIKAENAGYKVLQVSEKKLGEGRWVLDFPIWHVAGKTVHDIGWNEFDVIIKAHKRICAERYATLPDGAFWDDDIREYRRLYESLPDNAVTAELGTAYGKSLCSVADIIRRKNIHVHAVDLFTGTECEGAPVESYEPIFKKNIYNFGIAQNVTTYKGYTHDISKQFPDNWLDLVFVDASHLYEDVKQDVEDWYPKLKKDGIMSGHDYS